MGKTALNLEDFLKLATNRNEWRKAVHEVNRSVDNNLRDNDDDEYGQRKSKVSIKIKKMNLY